MTDLGRHAKMGDTTTWMASAFNPESDPLANHLLSADGEKIIDAVKCENQIRICDLVSGQTKDLDLDCRKLNPYEFFPTYDGQLIAFNPLGDGLDRTIMALDAQTGKTSFLMKGTVQGIFSVQFSPDAKHLFYETGAAGDKQNLVRLADQKVFTISTERPRSSAFSPGGVFIARTASNGAIHLVPIDDVIDGKIILDKKDADPK